MSSYKFREVFRRLGFTFFVGSLLLLSACGGSDSGEGEKTAPVVTVSTTEVPGEEVAIQVPVTAERSLERITINPFTDTLAQGTALDFTVTGFYTDSSHEDLSNIVSWSVDNLLIATIDSVGILQTTDSGIVTVTATTNEFSISHQITITPATLDSIEIIPAQAEVAAGTQKEYLATGYFSDGSIQDLSQQVEWVSSETQVALFTDAQITALNMGDSVITASLDNIESHANLRVNAASLERIEINTLSTELAKGTAGQLTVTAYFSDYSSQDITQQVSWQVEKDTIIEVSSTEAILSAVNVGSSYVTASFSGLRASAMILVSDAVLSHLEIQPTNPDIASGNKQLFSATGVFSDQSTQDFTQLVSWQSSDSGLADIDNRNNFKGLASGFTPGQVDISASYQQLSVSTQLKIDDAILVNIEVEPAHLNLANGLDQYFTAMAYYSDGSHQLVTDQVQWASSDKQVSYISAGTAGLFKANAVGATKIIASLNGIQFFTSLTVIDATLESLSISLASDQQPVGIRQQLVATGHYSDGSSVDVSQQAVWQVSNSDVASVDRSNGKIWLFGEAIGSSEISVHLEVSSADATIQVTSAVLQQIQLLSDSDFLYVNQKVQLQAEGFYSDGSRQNLTSLVSWFSDDHQIASISNSDANKGHLNALSDGEAGLTASFDGITAEEVVFTIIDEPDLPSSISIQASPNVIYNDGVDSTTLSVTVKPLQQQGVIADGTAINFVITEDGVARNMTSLTADGVASIELNSVFEGFISVKAEMLDFDIIASTYILSTSNFNYVLQIIPIYQGSYSNGVFLQGSMFGLYMRNLSNRDFSLLAFDVKNGGERFPESPVTNPDLLSDGLLSGGEYTGLIYQLDGDTTDNGITVSYILADPELQQLFGFTVGFSK